MKAIETFFQTLLFCVSSLCLMGSLYKICTTTYSTTNLAVILIVCAILLFAIIFSGSLLIKNQNTK